MQDGTPWPGNNVRDHLGMIQVFVGHSGGHDTDGNELPRLVYVSREKRPGFNHHKKVGAMHALVRVSAVLTNAPYLLNVDCDHYIKNSKTIREAMCFMMDHTLGKKVAIAEKEAAYAQRYAAIMERDVAFAALENARDERNRGWQAYKAQLAQMGWKLEKIVKTTLLSLMLFITLLCQYLIVRVLGKINHVTDGKWRLAVSLLYYNDVNVSITYES